MTTNSSAMLKAGTLISGADVLQSAPVSEPEIGSGSGSGPPGGRAEVEVEGPMALPSGRRLSVVVGSQGEELRVYAPDGAVEVTITLTDAGPVVRLQAARLELAAAEKIAVTCEDFQVAASRAIDLSCVEDLRVKSEKDVYMEGAVIWLN